MMFPHPNIIITRITNIMNFYQYGILLLHQSTNHNLRIKYSIFYILFVIYFKLHVYFSTMRKQ